jgi:hypothetical protein
MPVVLSGLRHHGRCPHRGAIVSRINRFWRMADRLDVGTSRWEKVGTASQVNLSLDDALADNDTKTWSLRLTTSSYLVFLSLLHIAMSGLDVTTVKARSCTMVQSSPTSTELSSPLHAESHITLHLAYAEFCSMPGQPLWTYH